MDPNVQVTRALLEGGEVLRDIAPVAKEAAKQTLLDMIPFVGTYRAYQRGDWVQFGLSLASDVLLVAKVVRIGRAVFTLGGVIRELNASELAAVRGGAMPRKAALARLAGLSAQVEKHLAKIASQPTSQAVNHWRTEIRTWLRDMEAVVPALGKKTGEEWTVRIAAWQRALME